MVIGRWTPPSSRAILKTRCRSPAVSAFASRKDRRMKDQGRSILAVAQSGR
jgi:hypothetical protein